jgi:hypothetical protein
VHGVLGVLKSAPVVEKQRRSRTATPLNLPLVRGDFNSQNLVIVIPTLN